VRILILERFAANAIMGGARNFANLWLLPAPSMVGERLGIRAESIDDGWYGWFFRERLGLEMRSARGGDLGTVKLERTAAPGELGRSAFGPAVWVFSSPLIEGISGRAFRAGYSDQPHVVERDRVALGQAQKGK
jgi:hypothetical protein